MFVRMLFGIACVVVPALTFGQSRFLQSPEEVRKVTEGIVASASANNLGGALKELRPLAVIATTDFDVVEAQINSQQAGLFRQFGAATGYEFVRQDTLGSRMIRYQYLVFHEKAAMRWHFVAYKAEKGWVLPHFSIDSNALSFFADSK